MTNKHIPIAEKRLDYLKFGISKIKIPSKATLRKYGLKLEEWMNMFNSQRGKCPICERSFDEKVRPCVDHFHVKNFKKMKPEQKQAYVRGLACFYCNRRLLAKGMTTSRAYNIFIYLKRFDEDFKASQKSKPQSLSTQPVPKIT